MTYNEFGGTVNLAQSNPTVLPSLTSIFELFFWLIMAECHKD